jgi:hypothetical protein
MSRLAGRQDTLISEVGEYRVYLVVDRDTRDSWYEVRRDGEYIGEAETGEEARAMARELIAH